MCIIWNKKNRDNYKLNKTILKNDLIKIIENNKNDMKKDTYEIYKKYIFEYINNNEDINSILFFSEIIDIIDISLGKKEMFKENIFTGNKIIKNKKIIECICNF